MILIYNTGLAYRQKASNQASVADLSYYISRDADIFQKKSRNILYENDLFSSSFIQLSSPISNCERFHKLPWHNYDFQLSRGSELLYYSACHEIYKVIIHKSSKFLTLFFGQCHIYVISYWI